MLISLFSCSMIEWHCSMFIKSQQLAQLFYICCIIKATYRIHSWLSALHTFAYYMQFAYGNILPSPISMSFSIQVKWPFVIRRWHANEHMTPSTQAQSAYSYMDLLTCLNGRLPSCWMERTITGHFNHKFALSYRLSFVQFACSCRCVDALGANNWDNAVVVDPHKPTSGRRRFAASSNQLASDWNFLISR